MSKESFIRYLGENNVSIFHFDNKDEFMEELNNAGKSDSEYNTDI